MSIENQMHLIGITLGWIIFAGYIWSVMNYFVKLVNRKLIVKLPRDSWLQGRYKGFMHAVIKSHKYVPLFVITILVLHLLMELIHAGFFITGIITFCLMVLQISLGLYGANVRNSAKGPWFYAHRIVAILLFISIVVHVITVIIFNP